MSACAALLGRLPDREDPRPGAAVLLLAAVVLGFVFGQLLDVGGTRPDVVRGVLGAVLVLSYVAVLVLATRWRPAPVDQL